LNRDSITVHVQQQQKEMSTSAIHTYAFLQLGLLLYSAAVIGRTGGYGKPWTQIIQIVGGTPANRATVVLPNIRACNGVIHVINAVLIPPQ
jgi:hypothetical protein